MEPHPSGNPTYAPGIIFTVTNIGPRDAQLRGFGVVGGKGNQLPVRSDIGVHPRLGPGEEVGVAPRVEDVFGDTVGARTVYVEDTHGRSWTMPRRAFRSLRDRYQAALADSEKQGELKRMTEAREFLKDALRSARLDTGEEQ